MVDVARPVKAACRRINPVFDRVAACNRPGSLQRRRKQKAKKQICNEFVKHTDRFYFLWRSVITPVICPFFISFFNSGGIFLAFVKTVFRISAP